MPSAQREKPRWYDSKAVVVVLLIFFFPVGLYALWKNAAFSTKTKWVLTGMVAFVCVVSQFSKDPSQREVTATSTQEEDTKTPTRSGPSMIQVDTKQLVVQEVLQWPGVRDAAISQKAADPRKVNLALIVGASMSQTEARQLGENFLRLTKSLSPDDNPRKEVGRGVYDYLIGVYTADQKEVALGAKVAFSPKITW